MAIGHMNISQRGKDMIKSFEGFRAQAYKALITERYYTIGYGHYGPDVKFGQVITKRQAEEMLDLDLARFVAAVNRYDYKYDFNQNEFDALVSFTYNLGEGCLDQVTANGTRTKAQIAEKMLLYYNAGGKKITGLVNRRKAEHDLFCSGSTAISPAYELAVPTLRRRCKGDKVKVLQQNINDLFGAGLAIDGSFGPATQEALRTAQGTLGICMDGIYGPITAAKFKELAREEGYNI